MQLNINQTLPAFSPTQKPEERVGLCSFSRRLTNQLKLEQPAVPQQPQGSAQVWLRATGLLTCQRKIEHLLFR